VSRFVCRQSIARSTIRFVSIAFRVRRARRRGASWLALLGVAAGCGGASAEPSGTPPPTTPPPALDVSGWVSARDGTMPVVIVAPHGGDLSPDNLPDRQCAGCEVLNDANTQELAQAVGDAFERRTGRRPFVVANRLHRRKFDGNRERAEATGGHAPLDPMWDRLHLAIDSAKARALRLHPRALLIDLHGHAHDIARLELGYLLTSAELRLADSLLGPRLGASSIARLGAVAASGDRGATLVRGPRALGTRLAVAGYPAVPSASDPAPRDGDPYFSGGYNTRRHGSLDGGAVDAIQLECNYAGVRDTAAARAAFAEALVTALLAYLADHYSWLPG